MKYVWVLEWYPDSSLVDVFSQKKLAIQYARKQYAEENNGKLVWRPKPGMLVDPAAKDDDCFGICYSVIKCEVVRRV